MAEVIACRKPQVWEFDASEAQKPVKSDRADYKAFAALVARSDAVDTTKTLVGLVVPCPFACGHAYYTVVKAKPLTLEHVPFSTAWRLHGYEEKEITPQSILNLVKWDRHNRGKG